MTAIIQAFVDAQRRIRMAELATQRTDRAGLEARHGQVWDTAELERDFEVTGFMAPFVVVRRRRDGQVGSASSRANPASTSTGKRTDKGFYGHH